MAKLKIEWKSETITLKYKGLSIREWYILVSISEEEVWWWLWSEASRNLAAGTTMLAEEIALRYCRYRIKGLC